VTDELAILERESAPLSFDNLRRELAQMNTIQDIKDWQDKAKALKAYASKRRDRQAQANELTKAIVWSMREMGRIIEEMQSRGELVIPGQNLLSNESTGVRLKDVGISRDESSWSQMLYAVPEEIIEQYFDKSEQTDKQITIKGAIDAAKQWLKEQAIDEAADDAARTMADDAEFIAPTIYLADAVEFMSDFDDDWFDLLLTDPPYSTDVDDIESFANAWLPLALSKVNPSGRAYICIGAYPAELLAYLSILQRQDKFVVDAPLIWTYRNTLGVTPKMKYNLNYQVVLHLYSRNSRPLDNSITNEMFSVQDINAPDGRLGDRYHTWQKPDELARRLIKHSTLPGEKILDPFACTGTFPLVAARMERWASACDLSADNLRIAQERGCIVVLG
jgi:DNA modification methylase